MQGHGDAKLHRDTQPNLMQIIYGAGPEAQARKIPFPIGNNGFKVTIMILLFLFLFF
jgi:hypothetical protein